MERVDVVLPIKETTTWKKKKRTWEEDYAVSRGVGA